LAYSRDGALLAAVEIRPEASGEIHVWDAQTGWPTHRFQCPGELSTNLSFGPQRVLHIWNAEGMVYCWDLAAQRERWRFSLPQWLAAQETFSSRPSGGSLRPTATFVTFGTSS
jgi:hypothetical protein